MTGVRFLFRVTLRRHDLAAEVYHLKEPQKLPLVMSPEEAKRLLAMSGNLKVHVMLALGYGCGLRAMTLSPHEFIRRFLMHVLPKGFHRIRHYGLFANGNRAANVARSRELLGAMPRVVEPEEEQTATPDEPRVQPCTCPRCGARMIIIEVFARGCQPRYRPTPAPTSMRIDTS